MSEVYFQRLQAALIAAGRHLPTLVVDTERLTANMAAVRRMTAPGLALRVVEKSLPAPDLLRQVMAGLDTNRLMSFHLPFVRQTVAVFPEADILLGKPMPVGAVAGVSPALDAQVNWLIDSPERLAEYGALAAQSGRSLRICLEVDIGLHRGGFTLERAGDFTAALTRLRDDPNLHLTGLMGYEPHIARLPRAITSPARALDAARAAYARFHALAVQTLGAQAAATLIYNTGGSSTFMLYDGSGPGTEVALASALVKPTDFDLPALEALQAAAFIAAPVLKTVERPEIPMARELSRVLRLLGRSPQRACFIYGGNWLADPCHPAGARRSALFGHSSNQEMYDLPTDSGLKPGDFLFFRPRQSEALFLQFGDIAAFDGTAITDWWPVWHETH
ncbi:alanine racemase [Ruegeria sp. WL0004]|uniref:Alanine racemase n=1 Tax=Ruegeria marisflavi TaxID=2984152 RepID=A0ABT2WT17_9RHOB|nr:alanine racemase [Ruegeria sp. WL0004]MCU9838180.1 alanine racemase [Ruegeria sp. WL0004]